MKTLDQLLRSLGRDDVEELTMVSGRFPCVRVGSSFDPVDDVALTSDSILAMLVAAGGSRYVDTLGPVAKQWRARAQGLGVIRVAAFQRGQHVEARLSLEARPAKTPTRRSMRPVPPRAEASTRPPSSRGAASRPPSARARVSSRPSGSSRPPVSTPPGSSRPPVSNRRPGEPAREPPRTKRRASDRATARFCASEAKRPQVRVRPASGASHPAWTSEADTQPDANAPETTPGIGRLLERAREASASDLHLVAGRPLLLRVGGVLRAEGGVLAPDRLERMLRAIVPPRLLPVLDDVGSCDFALDQGALGRFRVNVSRQQTGMKASLRLVPRDLPTLRTLGLPPEITRASGHHQGLVVFTGPTGHGKTTTMTAVVDHINHTTTHHVITVEDPVENVHPKKRALISQREVGTHTRSFASALRAALREDPDVIVVGELRDAETVAMAVAASETGHLVLGTMNTPSAAKTIDRLIDLFPPADQPQVRLTLATGLRLVVGQRLVPNLDRSGVHAAIEILPGSVALSALIRDNKTFQIPSLQQRGKGAGILRLDESLFDLARSSKVAVEDALAFAEAPAELEANLKRAAAAPRIP